MSISSGSISKDRQFSKVKEIEDNSKESTSRSLIKDYKLSKVKEIEDDSKESTSFGCFLKNHQISKDKEIEDDSISLSADELSVISPKETVDEDLKNEIQNSLTSINDSASQDCMFSYNFDDLSSSCKKVDNILKEQSPQSNDKLGSFPCNSCEFTEERVEQVEISYCWGCCKVHKSWRKLSEYWLISVPCNEKTVENLNAATKSLSQNYKFHTPTLKVGILDKLIEHTEHLKTLDKFVKEVVQNIFNVLKDELGHDPDLLEENLKVKNLKPSIYLTRFKWDKSKYPTWNQISIIADQIYSYLDNINECLKQKLSFLEEIKEKIKPYEQRKTESLTKRYLGDIVKKEHFVQDSQYLTTLLVVVPNKKKKLWENTYTNLCEMIVPDSSRRIFKTSTESLYSVTLAKKNIQKFKRNASIQNFTVRDYEYSEEEQATEKKRYENLSLIKSKLKAEILRWSIIMFGETFEAWLHVKTLRIFVESVVRFGLPVNYQAMLLLPLKSKTKLKKLLRKLYKDIDSVLSFGDLENIPGGLDSYYDVSEYYPYVYFKIDLAFIYA